MGMYVHVVFGVMLTNDLGDFKNISPQTKSFLEQLGSSHTNPNLVSFHTVDEPAHCVGVYVGGTDYEAMKSIPLSKLTQDATHWMTLFQQCVSQLPPFVQSDIAQLQSPAFHVISGVN